jgi:hypothetical protein
LLADAKSASAYNRSSRCLSSFGTSRKKAFRVAVRDVAAGDGAAKDGW